MRIGPALRHHATALLAGFIGGAAGWFLLDSTVSAQSDVVEASKIVVGNSIFIENGKITIRAAGRSKTYTSLNLEGLTIQDGKGRGGQSATVNAGKLSVTTRYDEKPTQWKRVSIEAGAINYYPDWKEISRSPAVDTLDMDVLFKRQRAELNARKNRRGRI